MEASVPDDDSVREKKARQMTKKNRTAGGHFVRIDRFSLAQPGSEQSSIDDFSSCGFSMGQPAQQVQSGLPRRASRQSSVGTCPRTMTMTRRRLLLLALPVALALLAVGATWLLLPQTAITRANAARIKPGMTLAQVEAILGGPARHEGDSGVLIQGVPPLEWETDGLLVCVSFSREGFYDPVGSGQVDHCNVHSREQILLEEFRRWLGL
jgi:hypothetical protein